MDSMPNDGDLFTVSSALLSIRRSILGHYLVYRTGGFGRRLHWHQFRDLAVTCAGRNAFCYGRH